MQCLNWSTKKSTNKFCANDRGSKLTNNQLITHATRLLIVPLKIHVWPQSLIPEFNVTELQSLIPEFNVIQSLMWLSSLLLNSVFLPDHPCALQLVRHETKAWNNKFNCRYDTIRLQTIRLQYINFFESACVLFVVFPCGFLELRAQCFHSTPDPFWFYKDSPDRCECRPPLKHVLLCNGVHHTPKILAVSLEIYRWMHKCSQSQK